MAEGFDSVQAAGTVDVTMPDTGVEEGTTVVAWLKRPGEAVDTNEPICRVGWNGSTAEIGSPAAGVVRMLAVAAGSTVPTGTSLALIDTSLPEATVVLEPGPAPEPEPVAVEPEPEPEPVAIAEDTGTEGGEPEPEGEFQPLGDSDRYASKIPQPPAEPQDPEPQPVAVELEPEPPEPEPEPEAETVEPEPVEPEREPQAVEPEPEPVPEELVRDAPRAEAPAVDLSGFVSPAVRRLADEHSLDLARITGSGRDGRVTLRDVRAHAHVPTSVDSA